MQRASKTKSSSRDLTEPAHHHPSEFSVGPITIIGLRPTCCALQCDVSTRRRDRAAFEPRAVLAKLPKDRPFESSLTGDEVKQASGSANLVASRGVLVADNWSRASSRRPDLGLCAARANGSHRQAGSCSSLGLTSSKPVAIQPGPSGRFRSVLTHVRSTAISAASAGPEHIGWAEVAHSMQSP